MASLNWTAEAEIWLRDIHDYIAADDPESARRVVNGILDRVQILLRFPEAGYLYEPAARPLRILLYGHYRIAYILRDHDNIDILGVFHGALDMDRYLN